MTRTVVLLLGPKGSGKTHVARVLQTALGLHFVDVEPLWLDYYRQCREAGTPPSLREGQARIRPLLEQGLREHGRIVVETTGAAPEILDDLQSLDPARPPLVVRLHAPVDVCLDRIARRSQRAQISMDEAAIREVHRLSEACALDSALTLDTTASSDAEMADRIGRLLDAALRTPPSPFLTARWESLVLLNFTCPRELLLPFVPAGTELDDWHGESIVSLVAFLFRDTRLRGVAIPGHVNFEEANLRFYVRHVAAGGDARRAVVFIRELVPKRAVSIVARLLYNEPYLTVPMRHDVELDPERGGHARYSWDHGGGTFVLGADVVGPAVTLAQGSEAEFITEHYWGYTRQPNGSTLEYRVEHPPWRVWTARDAVFTGPAAALYGNSFGSVLTAPPRSAFVSPGSEVAVYPGTRLTFPRADG